MKTIYTLRDGTGESQSVVVCAEHSRAMTNVDDLVDAAPADADCDREFCEAGQ
jgi:hypothetical protein